MQKPIDVVKLRQQKNWKNWPKAQETPDSVENKIIELPPSEARPLTDWLKVIKKAIIDTINTAIPVPNCVVSESALILVIAGGFNPQNSAAMQPNKYPILKKYITKLGDFKGKAA